MPIFDADVEMAIKALQKEIASLKNIQGGPGVQVHRRPGGTMISAVVAAPQPAVKKDVAGEPKALGSMPATADTDTYDRQTDKKPVQFDVVTDMQYDETTHKMSYRTRTIVAVGLLSVSEESELVEVFTAEECA